MTIQDSRCSTSSVLDHEFEANTAISQRPQNGEALIMMATEGSNHVGIYKLLPDHCTKNSFSSGPSHA
jgi:hypothetical protein